LGTHRLELAETSGNPHNTRNQVDTHCIHTLYTLRQFHREMLTSMFLLAQPQVSPNKNASETEFTTLLHRGNLTEERG
jgi:hypothetical protein